MTIQPLTEKIKRSRHLIIPNKAIYAMNIAYTPLTSYIDLRLWQFIRYRTPLLFFYCTAFIFYSIITPKYSRLTSIIN